MATLILDRSEMELRCAGGALALYEGGERRSTVPLNLLERVVIQGNLRLDTSVLTRLAEAGVAVALLSRRQSRRVAFVLGAGHSDAAIRLAQCSLALDQNWCMRWARRLVGRKLNAQSRILLHALNARPDCRKPLTDAHATVRAGLETLGDGQQSDLSRIRGVEGAAAAAYFRGFTSLFADALGFSGRNRRPPRDPVNACLSLGYTLLHFDAVRAAHAAGLDVMVGFYHRPSFGRESLACDLIEPIRPKVDAWVWLLFRDRMLREENFTRDKGACLLHKAGRERFYQAYDAFAATHRRLLRRECQLVARSLRANGESLLEPPDAHEEF